jgi:hypothetical protein
MKIKTDKKVKGSKTGSIVTPACAGMTAVDFLESR